MNVKNTASSATRKGRFKRATAVLAIFVLLYPVLSTIAFYEISFLRDYVVGTSSVGLWNGVVAPFTLLGATIMLALLYSFFIFPTPAVAGYFALRTFHRSWIGWKEVTLVALMLGLISWVPQSWFPLFEGHEMSYSWRSVWLNTWRSIPAALASAFAALCCWKILRMTGVLQRIVKVAQDSEAIS